MCSIRRSYPIIQTLFFLLIATIAAGQTRIYEIRFSNSPIGTLEVKQESTSIARRISIKSRVTMKILSRMEVDIYAEFRNNSLYESKAIRNQSKNGSDDKETLTIKTDKGYNVTRKGEMVKLLPGPITYTVGDLYFDEPKDQKQVYSETLGVFLPVRFTKDKRYELTLPDGKKSWYKYEKGKMTEVEFQTALGKAYFKLMQEK